MMDSPTPAPAPSAGNFRWAICTLLFFSITINYLDRQLLSILKQPLSDTLGWTDADYGWVTAAFSFAYALGYLVGGRFMDTFGVRRGIPLVVFLWSTAAVAHGFCAYLDVTARFSVQYPWFSGAQKTFVTATLAVPMTAAGFTSDKYTVSIRNSADTADIDVATQAAGTAILVKVSATWGTIGVRPYGLIASGKVVRGPAVMRKEST